MKKIRIEHLNLTCRGISPALAQSALNQFGPALAHRLDNGRIGRDDAPPGTLHVSPRGPAALAQMIAGRVAAAVRNNSGANPPIT